MVPLFTEARAEQLIGLPEAASAAASSQSQRPPCPDDPTWTQQPEGVHELTWLTSASSSSLNPAVSEARSAPALHWQSTPTQW